MYNLSASKIVVIGLLAFVNALFYSASVQSAELVQKFTSAQGVEFSKNPGLIANGGSVVRSLVFTPSYKASYQDGLDLLRLTAKVYIRRTDDENVSTNRDDPSLDFSWLRDLPRGSLLLDTHWDRTASRDTEFDDSGRVFRDGSRISKRVGATWRYGLSQRLTFSAGGSYTDIDYQGVDLIAYSSWGANSSLTYENTEKLSTVFSLGYFDQERDNGESSSAKSASLGVNYALSPKIMTNGALGLRKTEGSLASGSGETYNFGASYLLERGSISGTMSRSVSPSGGSNLVETDRYRIAYSYGISENWQVAGGYSLNENKSVNEVKLRQLDFSASRLLSEAWSTRIYVTARERSSDTSSADSQTVGISFTYMSPEF